jgi:hypothetical protein
MIVRARLCLLEKNFGKENRAMKMREKFGEGKECVNIGGRDEVNLSPFS